MLGSKEREQARDKIKRMALLATLRISQLGSGGLLSLGASDIYWIL